MNTAAVLDVVVKAQTSKASVELKKFEKTLKQTAKSAKDTDRNFEVANKKVTTFGSSISDTNQRAMLFKNTVGLIKFPAMIAGLGGMAQAAAAASAGVGGLASALAPLSGLLAAYPALIGAFGQAMGVKAVAGLSDVTDAVGGLNEKLDETSDEFKALSPQAQEFARSLQTAKAPLLDIQKTVQRPLFEGLNEGLQAAQKNLPELEEVMQGTAGAMGRLAAEAGRFVGREGFGRDFQEVGGNNAQLLGRLGDAGLHFADALRHVVVVSQPLIDFLGRGAVKLGEWIEAESRAGRESGRMAEFFERTEKVVRQLVSIGSSLASVFLDIGAAARPLGEEIMAELVKQAEALSDWTGSHGGELRQYFEDAKKPLWEAGRLVGDLVKGFFELSNTPGLTGFIKQFRVELLPVLVDMTKQTTKAFGPVLIDALVQFVKLLTNFVGTSGPLTHFVELLGAAAEGLNNLFESIPALATAASSALAGFSIFKLLGLGKLTGAGASGGLMSTIGEKLGKRFGVSMGNAAGPAAAGLIAAFFAGMPFGHKLAKSINEPISDALTKFRGADLKTAIENVTKAQIRGWVQAGDVTVAQAGRMIRALKDVNQQAGAIAQKIEERRGIGFAEAIAEDGNVTRTEVGKILDQLEALKPKARKVAIDTMTNWLGVLRNMGQLSRKEYDQLVNLTEQRFGNVKNTIKSHGDDAVKFTKDNFAEILHSTDRQLGQAANNADKHGKKLKNSFGGSVTALAHTSYEAMKNIGENVNEAGKQLGVQKQVKFSFKDMGKSEAVGGAGRMRGGPIELALGGLAALVPGRSTGDRHTLSIDGVPKAKVESGEGVFVGNRKMMGAAAAANAAVPRFATGGVAQPPGDPGSEVVQAAYASDVGQFLKRFGMDLTQGYNPGGPSVSPGHLQLDAAPSLDVVPLSGDWDGLFAQGLKWALSQGMQVGYDGQYGTQSWPDHGEGNHAHIDWKSGGKLGAVVEQIQRQILEGPAGPLKDIGQKAVDKVTTAANKWLAKQAPMADTQGVGLTGSGDVEKVFADTARKLSTSKTATLALGMAGYAESGMRDLPGGMGSSQGALQLLVSTASGMGIDPHDEAAIASAFLLRGYTGAGGANKLAAQGLPAHMVAQGVQGSGDASGSNYATQEGPARAWMQRNGLQLGGLLALAEGGSIPELFPQLGSDDQDKRKETLDRILGKIGEFGIKDWWADPLYAGTKNVADYQDFASLAASSDITDANDNLIPGIFSREGIDGTQHAWLLKARDEAWNLRKNLIIAKDAMPGQIDLFEGHAGLINKTERRLSQVRDALHDAQEKLRDLLDEIERQRDKIERQRDIIEDAKEQLDKKGLSNAQKKHQQDRIDEAQKNIDGAQGVIENITGERIPGVENDIQRATRERDTLVSPITEALATKYADLIAIREGITNEGWTDDVTGKSFDSLKTIQGAGSSMDPNMEMPDNLHQIFGGTLNDIQQELLAMIPEAKPGDTVIDQLESALAVAGLTADLSDDIAAQSQIVSYWEEELARLQESGGSASDIGNAANSLKSARDALASLQETTAPEAVGAGEAGEADTLKLDLLMAENARLRMSAQQAGTFAGFFKQFSAAPTFHTGGIMPGVGEQSARVLGGEGIFTREQMQAMGGRGDVTVNVNLDGMDVVVETFIGGVLAKETRKALGRGPTVGRRTS